MDGEKQSEPNVSFHLKSCSVFVYKLLLPAASPRFPTENLRVLLALLVEI